MVSDIYIIIYIFAVFANLEEGQKHFSFMMGRSLTRFSELLSGFMRALEKS